jgi:hypothetical protein
MTNNDLDDLDTGLPALIGCGLPNPCASDTMGKLAAEGRNEVAFHTTLLAELRMIRQVLVELGGNTY